MSAIVNKVIKALHDLQTQAAVEALKNPRKTPEAAYDFGLSVGFYQGVQTAIEQVVKVLNEDEDDWS